MKKFFYLAVFTIFLNGCSSSASPTAETNAAANSSNPATVNQPNQAQTAVTQPANAEGAQLGNLAVTKNNARIWERTKQGGDKNAAPIEAQPVTGYAAADDSEIKSGMDERGTPYEIRIFRNNPSLLKVEKILTDMKNPQIRVYLKNGRVVGVPFAKLRNPATASVNEILVAAGAAPNPAPMDKEKAAQLKKEQQH